MRSVASGDDVTNYAAAVDATSLSGWLLGAYM